MENPSLAKQYRKEIYQYLAEYPDHLRKLQKEGGLEQTVNEIASRAARQKIPLMQQILRTLPKVDPEDFMANVDRNNQAIMMADEMVRAEMNQEVMARLAPQDTE